MVGRSSTMADGVSQGVIYGELSSTKAEKKGVLFFCSWPVSVVDEYKKWTETES